MISISNRAMKKNMFEEVINFTEDSLVGAQDENSLEEIRSQQIEPYSTLYLNILILSFYHFLMNTFIRFRYVSVRIRIFVITFKFERLK